MIFAAVPRLAAPVLIPLNPEAMISTRQPAPRPLLLVAAAVMIAAGSYAWAAFQPRPASTALTGGTGGAGRAGIEVFGGDVAGQAGLDGRLSLDDQIAFWQARVRRSPRDFLSMVQLGLAEAEKARLTIDLALYDQASAHVDAALAIDPHYGTALRARAQLRATLHDFDAAIVAATAAIDRDPRDDAARAILGDALLGLGRLDDADAAYAAISARSRGPAVDTRLAHLELVRGHLERAVALAGQAYAAAAAEPDADLAYYGYQLGEIARLAGDAALARTGYGAALSVRPSDAGSMIGLALLDAADRRTDVAIAGLRRAAKIARQPETLALLGDLLASSGDAAGAAAQYAAARAMDVPGSLAAAVYDRSLVAFELDHGGTSEAMLERARASAAARPDAAGHDLVAWALFRLGRSREALAESRLALATGTRDATILAHAGLIEQAAGDLAGGSADLRAALALGPALDPFLRAEATAAIAGS